MTKQATAWNEADVRTWLTSRIAAARADQVAAERHGRDRQDDCDLAAAEEMVCASLCTNAATSSQATFTAALDALLERDEYIWRGVYDDRRFDRHVRTAIRKIRKMAKTNTGFDRLLRYQ
ncbi:hypothetical protein [Sphingomonas sp.]|uniref:hypothetical protein n=1 Tax=Sphingomonas sp. TaxID=28214 RepID=UPI0035C7EA88